MQRPQIVDRFGRTFTGYRFDKLFTGKSSATAAVINAFLVSAMIPFALAPMRMSLDGGASCTRSIQFELARIAVDSACAE